MLGGGIQTGEVTEIAGMPGAGKTQLAMQLAVNAALPIQHGGVAGSTIYIDTEGSFSAERCSTMAVSLYQHVLKGHQRRMKQQQRKRPRADENSAVQQQQQLLPSNFNPDSILNGISVYRVHDESSLQNVLFGAVPQQLESAAASNNNSSSSNGNALPVRLIIIDSIAFHYRTSANSMNNSNNNNNSGMMGTTANENSHNNNNTAVSSSFVWWRKI